jgi:hypothetical protein
MPFWWHQMMDVGAVKQRSTAETGTISLVRTIPQIHSPDRAAMGPAVHSTVSALAARGTFYCK